MSALLSAGCSSVGAGSGGDAQEWNHQDLTPLTHYPTAEEAEWIHDVNAELKGTLKITQFPSTGMGIQGGEVYKSVASGVLDGAGMWGGHEAADQPLADCLELFGVTPYDIDVRKAAVDAVMPILSEEFAKDGVKLLGMVQVEPRNIYTQEPVNGLDDLQGLKLRAAGPGEADVLNALGAKAVITGDVGETLTGLDQGIYSGLSTTHDSALSAKWYEHVKYGWETGLGGATWYLIVNKNDFDSLPSQAQETVQELADEHVEDLWSQVVQAHEEGRKELEEKGIVVNKASPEDQQRMLDAMQPVWDEWVQGAGPRGQEVLDAALAAVKEAEQSG